MPPYGRQVFLNVPFDRHYERLFRSLVFTVHDCGFFSKCALESSDASEVRVEKLFDLIRGCKYGIHDLSRTTLDSRNRLPRFNMPLELGFFLGAKRFGGGPHGAKVALVLDTEPYRYQKFCSDISGQDIRAHGNKLSNAITAVRAWLREHGEKGALPGDVQIERRYTQFNDELPTLINAQGMRSATLSFVDYREIVMVWQSENPTATNR
jgi:hypothetical protein